MGKGKTGTGDDIWEYSDEAKDEWFGGLHARNGFCAGGMFSHVKDVKAAGDRAHDCFLHNQALNQAWTLLASAEVNRSKAISGKIKQ